MSLSTIQAVLTQTHTIALVGASDNPQRPAYHVMAYLLQQGYQVIPVSPKLADGQLLGQRVYEKLADIPQKIDMVDVFRNSDAALDIAKQAVEVGAKTLWLQIGVINQQAADIASAAGMQVVMDKCPAQEIPRLGLEKA